MIIIVTRIEMVLIEKDLFRVNIYEVRELSTIRICSISEKKIVLGIHKYSIEYTSRVRAEPWLW